MKICFDAFALSHFPNTGLYSYSYELIKNLLNFYAQPHYSLITNNDGIAMPFEKKKGLTIETLDINRKQNDYSLIRDYLQGNKIRLYHSLNNGFSLPHEKVCKYVTTIHDTLALSNKSLVDPKYYSKFNKLFPTVMEKSDKVIAVSNFLRDEILKYSEIPKERIEVIYPIVSKQFKQIWGVHSKKILMKKYNLSEDFVLSVGSIHPRKNLPLMLTVFKEVLTEESNIKLVIIGDIEGKRNPHYLQLLRQMQTLGIEDKVHFLGSVDYEDMPYFYNEAKCLLNLSMYEGYPLTAIEAKACGTPVVCNMNSSFTEALGDYPVYVDLKEPTIIAAEVLQLIYRKENPMFLRSKEAANTDFDTQQIRKLIQVYESVMYY